MSTYSKLIMIRLQKLSLKCCQLKDSHCEHLCPCLEENKMLLSLHLGCNSITDAGLFYISKVCVLCVLDNKFDVNLKNFHQIHC